MKFKIGDLVVFQKPHMNSYEWQREREPYLTAIIVENSNHRSELPSWSSAKFYNIYATDGRKYWDIREDRLAILAAVKD